MAAPRAVVSGTARLGRRTKDLTKRLRAGDIAVIDHEDIDRVAAEALVEKSPAAVVQCRRQCAWPGAPSSAGCSTCATSGRFCSQCASARPASACAA